ncbi:hypothetical protein DRO19_00410 [Candidatus Bathyarchaeota archaeon]|nr:MAG: hypothetical protein DRO19_00410 [Candidatus Bathyarchaeota archaeon]
MKSEGVSAHAPKLPRPPVEPVWLTLLKSKNPRLIKRGLKLKLQFDRERREKEKGKSRKAKR